jgi:[ribosomal protein S5]-alanine N-acetyltransferase
MLHLPDDIPTPRLVLRLMEHDAVDTCLAGDLQRAENMLGVGIPEELLDDPTALRFAEARLNADLQYRLWSIRAIILTNTGMMVGHIRFHSRPDPDNLRPFACGAVEFGYHIFRDYRRHGYATEAARAVMDWAKVAFGIRRFIVSVSPDNLPSLTVIARCGFMLIGEYTDEVDGVEHIYLREVAV